MRLTFSIHNVNITYIFIAYLTDPSSVLESLRSPVLSVAGPRKLLPARANFESSTNIEFGRLVVTEDRATLAS